MDAIAENKPIKTHYFFNVKTLDLIEKVQYSTISPLKFKN